MCGIAGHWGYAGKTLARGEAAAFTNSLTHRGPDGFGLENLDRERLWLGHRRLSIIDVSDRGHQPMSYADGRYWLTYNGEVYNYLELRRELESKGHHFRSDSDSEVILAAYAEWGPDCQLKFNGMWALAIWDNSSRKLFLSRDRFGIKPLHYRNKDGAFCFASELKSFLTLHDVDGGFDESILAETLTNINGQEGTPYTLLPNVRRLQGGYCMDVSADGIISIRQWWDPLTRQENVPDTLEGQSRQFRDILFDSCRLRLRSDVPVATSLSGGLDSSAVACSLAEMRREGIADVGGGQYRAFVACFPGTKLDESKFAKEIVDYAEMMPTYHNIDESIAAAEIEKVVFDLETIYWVPLVGPWAIYRAMRENGIRVSLDGHGADELLGGYNFYVERALDGLLSGRFNLRRYMDLRRVLAGMVGGSSHITRIGIAGELRWHLKRELTRLGLMNSAREIRWFIKRELSRFGLLDYARPPVRLTSRILDEGRRLLSGESKVEKATEDGSWGPLVPEFKGERRLYDENKDMRVAGKSPLESMLFRWFYGSVLPIILRNYDRASMSHGIEVRMPFMDWRLVTLGASLPEENKIGGGYTKRVLREAMSGIMPDSIRLRTAKVGFTTPLNDWMHGPLKTWFFDTVSSQAFQESNLWDGRIARFMLESALNGHGTVDSVWPVINAFVLQKNFRAVAQNKNVDGH